MVTLVVSINCFAESVTDFFALSHSKFFLAHVYSYVQPDCSPVN